MKLEYRLFTLILIAILIVFTIPLKVSAAHLYFRMAKKTYRTGESGFVTLNLDTQRKTANAVSATISFDPNLIQITDISTDKTIFNMWVQSPVIDNIAGTISFKGVIFNPAFKGDPGRLIGFDFMAQVSGSFPFSLANFQVLANDGKGTPLSTTEVSKTISITGLNGKVPSSQINQKKDTTPPSSNTITVLPRQSDAILPTIRAKATDAKSGIAFYEVWANGKMLTHATSLESFKLKNLKVGKNSIEVKAFDKAGNVRSDKISVLYNPLSTKKIPRIPTPTAPKPLIPNSSIVPTPFKIKAPVLFN